MMDRLVGEYFMKESKLYPVADAGYRFSTERFRFYEVIRVINGRVIFLPDHLERLRTALDNTGFKAKFPSGIIRMDLEKLISSNKFREGNIKLLCSANIRELQLVAYYIPHTYPTEKEYQEGINLMTLNLMRPDPHLKQISVSESIREKVDEILKNGECSEILFVDPDNFITEGSKSNFFLVNEGILYTAPDNMVLQGITRKYVLRIARHEGIACRMDKIRIGQLENYEAAFICGTSPKILPVKNIDAIHFDPQHFMIRKLMDQFNYIVQKNINSSSKT